MLLPELLLRAERHLQSKQPFVLYHKPMDDTLFGMFQKTDQIFFSQDFTESGFVFTPFENIEKSVLFSLENSECLAVSNFKSKIVNSIHFQTDTLVNPTSNAIETHQDLVSKGIQAIKETELEKVVLSRFLDIDTEKAPLQIFQSLIQRYAEAFTYIWYHPKIGLWLGATPETLLSVSGLRFKTMSLAGTQSYEDSLQVHWGQKEREEQQIVTDTITKALHLESRQLHVTEAQTSRAGALLHLKSEVTGDFKSSFKLKSVLAQLHPTPAVCGFPKKIAKEFILNNEDYNREYYTGFLGELNMPNVNLRSATKRNLEHQVYRRQRGETNLYVNLRCLQLQDKTALIYVGGGITKDSNPDDEFWETHRKLQTMLSAI